MAGIFDIMGQGGQGQQQFDPSAQFDPSMLFQPAAPGVGSPSQRGAAVIPAGADENDPETLFKNKLVKYLQAQPNTTGNFFQRLADNNRRMAQLRELIALNPVVPQSPTAEEEARTNLYGQQAGEAGARSGLLGAQTQGLQQQQSPEELARQQKRQELKDQMDTMLTKAKIGELQARSAKEMHEKKVAAKREDEWAKLAETVDDPQAKADLLSWSQHPINPITGQPVPMPDSVKAHWAMKADIARGAPPISTVPSHAPAGNSAMDEVMGKVKGLLGKFGKGETKSNTAATTPTPTESAMTPEEADWLVRAQKVNPGVPVARLREHYKTKK